MIVNIVEFAMLLAPVSIPYHSILSSTAICITNIMACGVYRKTKEALTTVRCAEVEDLNPSIFCQDIPPAVDMDNLEVGSQKKTSTMVL